MGNNCAVCCKKGENEIITNESKNSVITPLKKKVT